MHVSRRRRLAAEKQQGAAVRREQPVRASCRRCVIVARVHDEIADARFAFEDDALFGLRMIVRRNARTGHQPNNSAEG